MLLLGLYTHTLNVTYALVECARDPTMQTRHQRPSTLCSWPTYRTLGLCSSCVDVSSQLVVECVDAFEGSDSENQVCNYTAPAGLRLSAEIGVSETYYVVRGRLAANITRPKSGDETSYLPPNAGFASFSSIFFYSNGPYFPRPNAGLPVALRALYYGNDGNISKAIEGLANGVTNRIREGGNASTSAGQVTLPLTVVHVNWPWLVYPASLSSGAAAFLAVVICLSARRRTVLWKSSLLPLLFRDWQGDDVAPTAVGNNWNTEAMSKAAKRALMRVEQSSGGKVRLGGGLVRHKLLNPMPIRLRYLHAPLHPSHRLVAPSAQEAPPNSPGSRPYTDSPSRAPPPSPRALVSTMPPIRRTSAPPC